MKFVNCTYDRHALQIMDVLNEVILTSTAIFDYKPRSLESMTSWFKAKQSGRFPIVGIEDSEESLLGFASYGTFRAWPAHKYSVEHSVYVHKYHRGKGLGRALMQEIIKAAEAQHYHVLIGCIEASNAYSIALHKSLGFTHGGTLCQVGYKFGHWLDLCIYQHILKTPDYPSETYPFVQPTVPNSFQPDCHR
jgi:phosphinothricin acetyltransferase